MSRKHKHIKPLTEGVTKRDVKNLDAELGPPPKPIKITATATTDGIKEFVDQFNKRDDYTVQPRIEE
jgi:hypothetical protein